MSGWLRSSQPAKQLHLSERLTLFHAFNTWMQGLDATASESKTFYTGKQNHASVSLHNTITIIGLDFTLPPQHRYGTALRSPSPLPWIKSLFTLKMCLKATEELLSSPRYLVWRCELSCCKGVYGQPINFMLHHVIENVTFLWCGATRQHICYASSL